MDPPSPSIRLCTLSCMRFSQRIPKREFSQYFPRVINCARIEMDGILLNAPSSRLPRPLQLPSHLASFYISGLPRQTDGEHLSVLGRYSGRQETAIRGNTVPLHTSPALLIVPICSLIEEIISGHALVALSGSHPCSCLVACCSHREGGLIESCSVRHTHTPVANMVFIEYACHTRLHFHFQIPI